MIKISIQPLMMFFFLKIKRSLRLLIIKIS